MLDLDYPEDRDATVDMNVVMTGSGEFIEIQGSGEEATFSETELHALLKLARRGIKDLTAQQRKRSRPEVAVLSAEWGVRIAESFAQFVHSRIPIIPVITVTAK